jgi:hypothetical protein
MTTITKTAQVEVEGIKFNIEVRSNFYANLNNPHWGANFYSATFVNSGNTIGGSAMMKRQQFRSQIEIAAKYLN